VGLFVLKVLWSALNIREFMDNILEFRNVNFCYNERFIIKDLSTVIKPGERVSLIGPSGSGKTTFLRLAAGLEKPRSGEIFLRGQKVADEKIFVPASQRGVGFVFQNFALFEKVSVEKNIYYGCKTQENRQEAQRLIELMGLQIHLKKYPSQLSGGERQRVALVRSLAIKPDLIFLDEPFSSIDPRQTLFLINEIKQVFTQLNVTALMVSHSMSDAENFSSHLMKFE
jgi:ABC-type Fe3+/spermidine/putrescine transport system ATPase subunit